MSELVWEPPGPGVWEIENVHATRPATKMVAAAMQYGLPKGFQYGTERYGLLLDYLQPMAVNGFIYTQARPFGAPPGASGPPPAPVLWLLTRLHPKMRARIKKAGQTFAQKRWRADLVEWDTVDRPAIVARHRAIQSIDLESLTDEQLAGHVTSVNEHLRFSHWMHHKYTVPSILVMGDLLVGVMDWTGLEAGEILGLIRGNSKISLGFADDELGKAADALRSSPAAQALLAGPGEPQTTLDALAGDGSVGAAVTAYLEAVRHRGVSYDIADKNAGELPATLLGALQAAVAGATASPLDAAFEAQVRSKVPPEHRDEFDERLAEARLVSRLRDERGVYSDGWATGLARRAMLEVGRRLVDAGVLKDGEHAVELSAEEAAALLTGSGGPAADEVATRFEWRTTHTTDDAPPTLGGEPGQPPSPDLLPRAARRAERAVGTTLAALFATSDREADATTVRGIPVFPGTYEGTARLVSSPSEFSRIRPGDVLVTRATSPYFNIVLPMLGAIVTDRGGALSHAAIVAREYGIPGVVGTREATATIPDGARVRVDGMAGEVTVLA